MSTRRATVYQVPARYSVHTTSARPPGATATCGSLPIGPSGISIRIGPSSTGPRDPPSGDAPVRMRVVLLPDDERVAVVVARHPWPGRRRSEHPLDLVEVRRGYSQLEKLRRQGRPALTLAHSNLFTQVEKINMLFAEKSPLFDNSAVSSLLRDYTRAGDDLAATQANRRRRGVSAQGLGSTRPGGGHGIAGPPEPFMSWAFRSD